MSPKSAYHKPRMTRYVLRIDCVSICILFGTCSEVTLKELRQNIGDGNGFGVFRRTQESPRNQNGAWNGAGRVHQRYQRLLPGRNRQVLLSRLFRATPRSSGTVSATELIV